MILIDIQQGTEEWKEFRRCHIGASDASSVLEINPWKNRRQLWKEKKDGVDPFITPAMKKGTELEPRARELLSKALGEPLSPAVGISEKYSWMMASFDGITGNISPGNHSDRRIIAEIKCGSKELHEMAKIKEIPPYYFSQVQQQIEVAEGCEAVYCSYSEEEDAIAWFWVQRHSVFIEDMIKKEEEFWQWMVHETPPPLGKGDYEEFENPRASRLLKEYSSLQDEEKEIKKRKELLKKEIIEVGPQCNFILDGAKIFQSHTSSYDFQKIKEAGINLDPFKKASKPFWTISTRGIQETP